MRRLHLTSLALALTLAVAAPAARAADVPADATWWEAHFSEPDGTMLHADILRPKGLAPTAKTPVILSIGPYFNHSGQLGPVGAAEGVDYDPVGPAGPNDRFFDFVEGAKVLQRGYTWVQVDLRGFGGSTGCLDWAGPGEQADVKAAVQWAAKQSWSTGKVGMYGKSYDGLTGLIGEALRPPGLAAVVSQEPVYDLYRYLYSNQVRYINSVETPALYDLIAGTPGPATDHPDYNENAANDIARPGCPVANWADQQDPNHSSAYWTVRNFIPKVKGSTIPLFMTQGFLENNTKPDGAFEFFNNVAGFKRAWFGMWDHVRGNDREDGRLNMGRSGWFDEVMRFYDRFVKGLPPGQAPTEKDPPVAVETSNGTWRSEAKWPPADSKGYTSTLLPGSYIDNGQNNGELADGFGPTGDGVWTFSKPLPYPARLSGVPRANVDVTSTLPGGNLVVNVYDVDAANNATLLSRNAFLLTGTGRGTAPLELYGNDWFLPKGHRVGVLVTSSNSEWWAHVPTPQSITVNGGTVTLPFLANSRTATIQGGPSIRLDDYKANAPFPVDAATVQSRTSSSFALPPAMQP